LSDEAVPVVVVGGGGFLFPDELPGAAEVLRPHDFDVANAVGVSIAEISATVDQIVHLDRISREEAFAEAEAVARSRIIAAGGDGGRFKVVEWEDSALPYLTGNALRIRIKGTAALVF